MATRRRMHRRRRRTRRSYNLRKRVMPSKGVGVAPGQLFFSTAATANNTGVQDVHVQNIPFDEKENRKLVYTKGRVDVSLSLSGGQAAELIHSAIITPAAVGVPTVADYDPFVDTPGETTWMGKPFKTIYRKYVARALPTGASAAVIDVPIRVRSRAVRLLRPGDELYLVFWHRASAGSKAIAAAYDLGFSWLQ